MCYQRLIGDFQRTHLKPLNTWFKEISNGFSNSDSRCRSPSVEDIRAVTALSVHSETWLSAFSPPSTLTLATCTISLCYPPCYKVIGRSVSVSWDLWEGPSELNAMPTTSHLKYFFYSLLCSSYFTALFCPFRACPHPYISSSLSFIQATLVSAKNTLPFFTLGFTRKTTVYCACS